MTDYRELLLGCGNSRGKRAWVDDRREWSNLTTLDIDPNCGADLEWDLERLPLPFPDESFNEIHAYDVLEHTGQQGDWKFFFAQFAEFWRILRPGGVLCCSVPSYNCRGTWGDPGHTRVINEMSLVFLCQPQYTAQVGKTMLTDYRHYYKADYDVGNIQSDHDALHFILRAIKPSRVYHGISL